MSGTSRDGMDAALIHSDGEENISCKAAITLPYKADFAKKLEELCALGEGALQTNVQTNVQTMAQALIAPVEAQLNRYAEKAVSMLLEAERGASAEAIDALAFHGHTIYHNPKIGASLQIGNGAELAKKTGITVVDDFRSCDIESGGQGAPLAPLYHLAIARYLRASEPALDLVPIVFLNIGGIANVTWIDAADNALEASMLAFDSGPGNALLDDWVATYSRGARAMGAIGGAMGGAGEGLAFDKDGAFARKGKCHPEIVEMLMQDPFFASSPPKSLDRKQFSIKLLDGLSLEDGAKTLTVFCAQTILTASRFFPKPAGLWLLCGGGRKNLAIVEELTKILRKTPQEGMSFRLQTVDELGFDGDALEAQAFAYLAIRRLKGKPTAYPLLTGASKATSGGKIHKAT